MNRCIVPECEKSSMPIFETSWADDSIPKKSNLFGSCERYSVKKDLSGNCSLLSFTNQTEKCDSWVYEPGEKTILNEVN